MALQAKDYVCGSCAGGEIISLSTHKNALEAMTHFCKTVLGVPGEVKAGFYRSSLSGKEMFNQSASHYVFISGPEETCVAWPNYGTDFAKFITDHKLGLVATLPPIKNRKYHPATDCKIWIWQPDQQALETWWMTEGSADIRAQIEAKKKADELARKRAEEAAIVQRRAYAATITQYTKNGIEPTIVEHCNAYATSVLQYGADGYGSSGSGQRITVSALQKGYLRNNGQQEYNHFLADRRNVNYTVHHSGPLLVAGKEYKIVCADALYWVLAE